MFITLVVTACTHVPAPENINSEIENYTQAINALSAEILVTDASQISRVLINTTIELADEYNIASPALYHNMLVNAGFRERGLCCHRAEDLHVKLREHNTTVIYAADSNWL